MIASFTRFPEWKALYDALLRLVEGGQKVFSYDELSALCGVDIRSGRGRGQFYRCRRQLLKDHLLWMECIAKSGYGIIPSKDHPNAAFRRVGQARRKVGVATAINHFARIEEMTSEQRVVHAAAAAVLNEVGKVFVAAGHKFKLAS